MGRSFFWCVHPKLLLPGNSYVIWQNKAVSGLFGCSVGTAAGNRNNKAGAVSCTGIAAVYSWCFRIFSTTAFDVGVLLFSATLLMGTNTFVSGK